MLKVVSVEGLSVEFGARPLFSNATFVIGDRERVALVGKNGAGKSTTIKAILNIIGVDGGEIKLLGKDYIKDEYEVKSQIAAVFDELPFYDKFNAVQINTLFRGLYKTWDSKTYFGYIERFGLPKKKKLKDFSKGMKMKLQIATALSHGAKLLIMDEATTGLDPVVRNEILDIFREYLQDQTNRILMSSHKTNQIQKNAHSLTFIDKGKILLSGVKDEILENHGLIKCRKEELSEIAKEDYISARISDFGAEAMVSDREACHKKYPSLLIEKTTLEEIMLFYVNREKKEWN